MLARLAADLLVLIHFGFIIFVVLGGLLVLRWPRAAWIHLPAAAWGAWIEFTQGVCPLTPLENHLRAMGGEAGYDGGFVAQYIIPIIYPPGYSPELANMLGLLVLAINVAVYSVVVWRALARRKNRPEHQS